jgi:hypothetical protein
MADIIFNFLKVTLDKMDALVDEAAHLPRKLGFAPKNAEIYHSDSERKAARSVSFG